MMHPAAAMMLPKGSRAGRAGSRPSPPGSCPCASAPRSTRPQT